MLERASCSKACLSFRILGSSLNGLLCLFFSLSILVARLTKKGTDEERCREILTSGGMKSLLTLFKTSLESKELLMVSSLTVVYLLPSLLDTDANSSSHIHMSVIECLQFLIQSSRESTEIGISSDEVRTASQFAMTKLWFTVLAGKLESSNCSEEGSPNVISKPFRTASITASDKQDPFSERRRRRRSRSSLSSQMAEHFDCSDLIDGFVSLSIMAAELEALQKDKKALTQEDEELSGQNMNVYYGFAFIIESICTREYAMPMAMKEGVITLLLRWLRSGDSDLERPAANALRNLTLTQDDYVAGWVHSQLLHENAFSHIVGRLESSDSRVRLAMTEAVLSLTIAPHTRAGIVEARGIKYLVQLLANATDVQTRDEELTMAAENAGNTLLQLVEMGTALRRGTTTVFHVRKTQQLISKESVIE